MNDTKRHFPRFSFYDRTGIEAYLCRQAEMGWMLEKITGFGWVFRRIAPKRIHFAVTYFPQASVFDPEPSEAQQRFRDFCAHTGWALVAANAQMQIFCNESEAPIPIETDAALEIETIHRAAMKSFIPAYGVLLASGLLQGGLFIWRLIADPIGILASDLNLFTGLCWGLVLAMSLVELIGYCVWRRRARAQAALGGGFLAAGRHDGLQLVILCLMLAALAFMLGSMSKVWMVWVMIATIGVVGAVTALILGLSALLRRRKASAAVNRTVTALAAIVLSFGLSGALLFGIISSIGSMFPERVPAETYEYNGWTFDVYHDALPLTVEDMLDVEYNAYSTSWTVETSFLLAQFHAVQHPRMDALEMPELRYTITKIKLPLLHGWCLQALLDSHAGNYTEDIHGSITRDTFEPTDAAPWGANAAYRLHNGEHAKDVYLICFDDRIIEVDTDWTLTPEQMAVIGEKLKTA